MGFVGLAEGIRKGLQRVYNRAARRRSPSLFYGFAGLFKAQGFFIAGVEGNALVVL
jgi:hypothetical protein